MEAHFFYFFVLPLGIFVGVLASLVFYYAGKEERAQRKLNQFIGTYISRSLKQKEMLEKRRLKQELVLRNELEKLEKLRWNQSIDETTYRLLKQILENSYDQKREEGLTQLNSAC